MVLLGYAEQASKLVLEAVALSRNAGGNMLGFTLCFVAIIHACVREYEKIPKFTAEALEVSLDQSMPQWSAIGNIYHGLARAMLGEHCEGILQLQEGLRQKCSLGLHQSNSVHSGHEATACLAAGWHAEAAAALDYAYTLVQAEERLYEAELHRLRGELLLRAGDRDQAVRRLEQAVVTARKQAAKTLELRAATSLARLWAEHGERKKGQDLIAPIYGWFTEGFDTADLKDAKALLDELA